MYNVIYCVYIGTTINLKDFKASSFIFIIIVIFFIIDFIGYKILRNQVILNNEKETQILVNELNYKTNNLLTKLLYEYSIQKNIMIKKHKIVMNYIDLQTPHPLDIDLREIKESINLGYLDKPYNINITNKAFVITNATLAKEVGFDISFAKESFDEHKRNSVIIPCPPFFEKSTQSFFSFTDEYITEDGDEEAGILQISYRYKSRDKELKDIQSSIDSYPVVKDVKAFTFGEEGFVHDIILQEYKAYKPTLEEVLARIEDGKRVKERLSDKSFIVDRFVKNGIHFKSIDISSNSIIFNNTEIVFSILIDETEYLQELNNLNIWILIITILGLIAIITIYKVRNKETKLNDQDKFIQSSMHEIKTPLSIITLNNQLRELTAGKDEYSDEIDGAMKVLKISYDDMIFAMSENKIDYKIESLSLKTMIQERVNYFKTIATSNSKKIELKNITQECTVNMSSVELTRVIDNNISNAIKYADINSTISIAFENNELSFHNYGNPIKDTKKIFAKYFRENKVVGGHGLGLNIVNDVAKKYSIKIEVTSDVESGTSFKYIFKCHTDDI